MIHFISILHDLRAGEFFIDSICLDYKSQAKILCEQRKFYTPYLLNRNEKREAVVNKRIENGYLEKTIVHKVVSKYNEWAKEGFDGRDSIEISFGSSSYLMHNNMSISFRYALKGGGHSVSQIKTRVDGLPMNDEKITKILGEIEKEVDIYIP